MHSHHIVEEQTLLLVFHMTLTIFYNFYKWFRVVGPLNATEYGHMSTVKSAEGHTDIMLRIISSSLSFKGKKSRKKSKKMALSPN